MMPHETKPEKARASESPESSRRDAYWKRAYAAKDPAELESLYAEWARDYDQDHQAIGYLGHEIAAETLIPHLKDRATARVLDAGAGTGAAGQALARKGVLHLTAIDLSSEMLEVAAKKGVYERVVVADLGAPVDSLDDRSFDAAISVGVYSYGQAPAHTLEEIVRLVKVGGLIALTMREDFEREDPMGVRAALEHLIAEGVLGWVERSPPAAYLPGKDPNARFSVLVFRVLEGAVPSPSLAFQAAVREAFTGNSPIKVIDHEHIWDTTASRLYEAYIKRPEYYLTDCEEEILSRHARGIAASARRFVELGCGSARKIGWLLDAALERAESVEYIPIDISEGALQGTVKEIEERFGARVHCRPSLGSFDEMLSRIDPSVPKTIAFFGGSAGNFRTLEECLDLLKGLADRMLTEDRLLVGFDLQKSEEVLLSAYNAGPENRSFFLHMVRRINRLLQGSFDLSAFQLASTYDEEPPCRGIQTRVMNLKVATRTPQRARIEALDLDVQLDAMDAVQVGVSRKFRTDDVLQLGALAGLSAKALWFDRRHWFTVAEFERNTPARS